MKNLLILAAASAALMTSACGTTMAPPAASASTKADLTWHQTADAQPFDAARSECRAATMGGAQKDAFANCMAAKGWTRG